MAAVAQALREAETASDIFVELAMRQERIVTPLPLQGAKRVLEASLQHVWSLLHAKPKLTRVRRRRKKLQRVRGLRSISIEPTLSAWDPQNQREVDCCRALLLEIVKRAAHDWVLYRTHSEMERKSWANSAYVWLFEEDENHPDYKSRLAAGETITSFIGICEATDLDPVSVRQHIRKLDVETVMKSGRPPENRKRRSKDSIDYEEHATSAPSSAFHERENPSHLSVYESHFAPNQIGYL